MKSSESAPINMHMHTHFSFNAEGFSPTQLVEESVRRGLYAIAICDFDVLDGLDELFEAADRRGLRSAAGMETRVYFSEYGDQVINSPGEPGVYYFMGMGFGRVPEPDSEAGRGFADLRRRAERRTRDMVDRINGALPDIAIDYDRDVAPLTPSGNATERHVVKAFIARARKTAAGSEDAEASLWAKALGVDEAAAQSAMRDDVRLQNTVRSKLMKSGGVGYVQPDSETFPLLDDVIRMILASGAIPMATWLNGLSDGESDMEAQLECLRAKGVAALNIVPDRNWNISNPEERGLKVRKLHETVSLAERMHLPVNVGTELNSFGLPFVDDFQADPMRPLWPVFLRGAHIMVGQSTLARFAGYSYCGPAARAEFGDDVQGKNAFFESVGRIPATDAKVRRELLEAGDAAALDRIRDAARQGIWLNS